MAWTYDGDPSANTRDAVRFALGDTDTNFQLFSDSEINYLLAQNSQSVNRAAILGCERLIAKFSKEVDYTIGPERVSAGDRKKAFEALLKTLQNSSIDLTYSPTTQDGTAQFGVGMMDDI